MCRREPIGITRALRRTLLTGLILIGVLALVCEALAAAVLIRVAVILLALIAHY